MEERQKLLKRQYEENMKKQQEMLAKEKEDLMNRAISLAESIELKLTKDNIFQIQLNAKIDNLKIIINEVESKEDPLEKIKTYKKFGDNILCNEIPRGQPI